MELSGSSIYRLTDDELSLLNTIEFTDTWKSLPVMTLLYYSIRLRKARQRINEYLAIAPVGIQSRLMKYDSDLAEAILKLDSEVSKSDAKITMLVPDELLNHPYIVTLEKFINQGFDETKAINAASEIIGVPRQRLVDFLKSHDIEFKTMESKAKELGVKLAKEKSKAKDLDVEDILAISSENGLTNPTDILIFANEYLK